MTGEVLFWWHRLYVCFLYVSIIMRKIQLCNLQSCDCNPPFSYKNLKWFTRLMKYYFKKACNL